MVGALNRLAVFNVHVGQSVITNFGAFGVIMVYKN